MLLIRVLERHDDRKLNPLAYVQNDSSVMHGATRQPCLVVPAFSPAPRFKVMVYPFRYDVDPLPETAWDKAGETLTPKWANRTDALTFASLAGGRTGFTLERVGIGMAPEQGVFEFGERKDAVDSLLDGLDTGGDGALGLPEF